MSTPVVVQGTAVSSPYATTTSQQQQQSAVEPAAVSDGTWTKGEKQETKCRDPIFALLFYGNLIAIAAMVAVYGTDALYEETTTGEDFSTYIGGVAICGVVALVLSGLGILVLMAIPKTMIKVSLIFVVVLSLIWAIAAFANGAYGVGIFGAIFFLIGCCYAYAVWSRIPFAAANLVTGTTAIKSNSGIIGVAYIFVVLAFGWTFLWSIALLGVWDTTYKCDENNQNCQINYGLLFLMFVSFFFAHQVIQNTVHVSVAGVVGSWWFSPNESGCCGAAVCGSFVRSVTTSFGSICFGSLLVAIVQALRAIANSARQNDDNAIIACIAECILACLQSILEYFNKWAFVYVGLYGYGYLEAGKNVITLFRNRGWEAIIADDLVGNTLFLVSVVVGGITGIVGFGLDKAEFYDDNAAGNPEVTGFVLGFVTGLVLCSIMMSTIGSSVNATIVLFAEAPAEFEQNYPELSRTMREAYRSAFPGCM